VIPWIIFALVVVPLVVVGFVVSRRRAAAGEHPASEDAAERARTEQEFAEAELTTRSGVRRTKSGTGKSASPSRVA
jgi:hypothetical protein